MAAMAWTVYEQASDVWNIFCRVMWLFVIFERVASRCGALQMLWVLNSLRNKAFNRLRDSYERHLLETLAC